MYGWFLQKEQEHSTNFRNNRTGAGLQKLSAVKQDTTYLTTAWFVIQLNDFFTIVTSRCAKVALSKNNPSGHHKATDHMRHVSYVFRHMTVGLEGHWKPVQKGVLFWQKAFWNSRNFTWKKGLHVPFVGIPNKIVKKTCYPAFDLNKPFRMH